MLDLIVSDTGDLIHLLKVVPVVPINSTPIHSDHHLINFEFPRSFADRSKNSSPHYVYDFVKANYSEMCLFLDNHLSEIEKMDGVEEIWHA